MPAPAKTYPATPNGYHDYAFGPTFQQPVVKLENKEKPRLGSSELSYGFYIPHEVRTASTFSLAIPCDRRAIRCPGFTNPGQVGANRGYGWTSRPFGSTIRSVGRSDPNLGPSNRSQVRFRPRMGQKRGKGLKHNEAQVLSPTCALDGRKSLAVHWSKG